jgi:hypothetical protein
MPVMIVISHALTLFFTRENGLVILSLAGDNCCDCQTRITKPPTAKVPGLHLPHLQWYNTYS